MKPISIRPADLARPHVPLLKPYVPGLQPAEPGWIKLNTNENPYPASPRVVEAIGREAAADRLRLYPDPGSSRLRSALAAHHGLAPENVCVGNGSDDILNLLFRVFCDGEQPAGFTVPSYSLYPVLAAIQDGDVVKMEFDRSMDLPIDRLASCGATILFLTSPNAPTGVGFPASMLGDLAQRFPGILVLDEAYADFAEGNAIGLVREYPNVCVTRTFSKAYSLAGLRVGYAMGSESIISLLDRVRDSYNVNRLSQAAALAALEDQAYFEETLRRVKNTRDWFQRELVERGWYTYDSQTNFLFTEPIDEDGRAGPEVALSLFEHLQENRVLVRYFPKHALTRSFLRISVGQESEMATLNEHIETWTGSE